MPIVVPPVFFVPHRALFTHNLPRQVLMSEVQIKAFLSV